MGWGIEVSVSLQRPAREHAARLKRTAQHAVRGRNGHATR